MLPAANMTQRWIAGEPIADPHPFRAMRVFRSSAWGFEPHSPFIIRSAFPMKHIIGPVIGAAIDRKDGDSGVKGAAAVKRYRTDAVKQTQAVSSTSSSSGGSGGGSGSSPQ